tara:strand:- start:445 stop:1575 length:1131 start_codon:yes stop_codon:yes gene_type:complete
MDFLNQRNLFRLHRLCKESALLFYPNSDSTILEDSFFELLEKKSKGYFFEWRWRKEVQDSQHFIDVFLTSYIETHSNSCPFLEKLYKEHSLFTFDEVRQIASVQLHDDSRYFKEYTHNGYFEKHIYICVDQVSFLQTYLDRYISLFSKDELISKEEQFFKYQRQQRLIINEFEKIYDKFGKNFLFDCFDFEKKLEVDEDAKYYRLLDTLISMEKEGFIFFNHLYYVPQYKIDYEKNRYFIVSYRIKANIGLQENWFIHLDPYFKKNLFVSKRDFSMVKFLGKTYKLTVNQARFTLFLYEKMTLSGFDKVSYDDVSNFIKINQFASKSVRDIFRLTANKTSPLYKKLVCFDNQHNYFLDKQFLDNVVFLPEFSSVFS